MLTIIAALALAAWLYLLFFHHGFWKADQRLTVPGDLECWPTVTALIPARDEAESIGACVSALAAQDYPGDLQIIVIDDSSTDETVALARQAGAAVIAAPSLAEGWTGKLWALSRGVDAAGDKPDYLWFNDADVVHGPDVLRQLAGKAQTEDQALVSLMVKLHCSQFWERLLVPAFIYFFQMLYPFPAVNNPRSGVAGAAGGCVLIRRDALSEIGGIAAIKDALIDDCALAQTIKDHGHAIWLGLAEESHSIRPAEGLGSLWHMVTRTAFTQLGYSTLFLLGTILGLSLIFLAPPVILLTTPWHGGLEAAVLSGIAWLVMAAIYRPTLRLYRRPGAAGLVLPVVAALYTAMTIHSAVNHWVGRSSHWKGRTYRR